jgi:hypothetical protein
MSESESRSPDASGAAEAGPEDDRRARAAEINRKRTEDEWNRNKKSWLKSNFPERSEPS